MCILIYGLSLRDIVCIYDLQADIMDRPHIYKECLVISKNNLTVKIENDIKYWDFDNYIYIDLM